MGAINKKKETINGKEIFAFRDAVFSHIYSCRNAVVEGFGTDV